MKILHFVKFFFPTAHQYSTVFTVRSAAHQIARWGPRAKIRTKDGLSIDHHTLIRTRPFTLKLTRTYFYPRTHSYPPHTHPCPCIPIYPNTHQFSPTTLQSVPFSSGSSWLAIPILHIHILVYIPGVNMGNVNKGLHTCKHRPTLTFYYRGLLTVITAQQSYI